MSDTKLCPYCGEEVKTGAIKCKHCHSMLEGEQVQSRQQAASTARPLPSQPASTNKPFYKRWWAWALAILFFFIFVGALSGGGDDTPAATPEPIINEPTTEEIPATSDQDSETAAETEPEQAPSTTETITANTDSATLGEKNAAKSALDYLAYMPFSYGGLVKQLEFEGYSREEAVYGVDKSGADWNEQAAKSALNYLNYTSFSYSGLVKQLEFEGFTKAEAVYGVDKCGADWNEQAALKAQDYLDYSSFSRTELIAQLEFEGFTRQQAEYGVQAVGY